MSNHEEEEPVIVTCINFIENDQKILFRMLKSQLQANPSKSKPKTDLRTQILFYKYRFNQLRTHPNYQIENSGDWDMSIYKCSLKHMSIFYFCSEYYRTNYYSQRFKRFSSISLMSIMRELGFYFIRNIRKKGSGQVVESIPFCDVKFQSFDGLPKHYVRAVFIKYDGNFKRLVCESEGIIYCFDFCTS